MSEYKYTTTIKGKNQCICCNKFRSWDILTEVSFTPSSEYTNESSEYVCDYCKKEYYKGIIIPRYLWVP